jgi:hypothetical protein
MFHPDSDFGLYDHMAKKFNICAWNDDQLNNHRLLMLADFVFAAGLHGREGVVREAEDILARFGNPPATIEPWRAELYKASYDMARAALAFVRGLKH